jgi:HSP20 family protein
MTLIRYEPWSVLNQLHGQINRLFDAEVDRDAATSAATADWIPQADIEEYADRFVLKLDVPGVELEAVEITLDNGLLTLSG